jgi:hypothetical protein
LPACHLSESKRRDNEPLWSQTDLRNGPPSRRESYCGWRSTSTITAIRATCRAKQKRRQARFYVALWSVHPPGHTHSVSNDIGVKRTPAIDRTSYPSVNCWDIVFCGVCQEADLRSITNPAPATPPHNPVTTAQRYGAERRQCCNATHAIRQPIDRLPNPKNAPGSVSQWRTIKRIQAAPPRHARTNAPTVLPFFSPNSPIGSFTLKITPSGDKSCLTHCVLKRTVRFTSPLVRRDRPSARRRTRPCP